MSERRHDRGLDSASPTPDRSAPSRRASLRQELRSLTYEEQRSRVAPQGPVQAVQFSQGADDPQRQALVRGLTQAGIEEQHLTGLGLDQLRALDRARQAVAARNLGQAEREIQSLQGQATPQQLDEFYYQLARPYFTQNPEIWETSEGPEPMLAPPSADAVRQARLKLANTEPLTDADITALLQQAVHDVRAAHIAQFTRGNARQAMSAEGVFMACGVSAVTIAQRLQQLGFSQDQIALHQAEMLFGGGAAGARHAFTALRIGRRVFLIDTTVRQFFMLESEIQTRHIGDRILQEPAGGRVAVELMTKGYIELDEAAAAAYGVGMAQSGSGERTPDQYAADQPFSVGERVRYRDSRGAPAEGQVVGYTGQRVRVMTDDFDVAEVAPNQVESLGRQSPHANPRTSSDLGEDMDARQMPDLPDLSGRSLVARIKRWLMGG